MLLSCFSIEEREIQRERERELQVFAAKIKMAERKAKDYNEGK